MFRFLAIVSALILQGVGASEAQTLIEMTGFSYYLGCDSATPACWVGMTPGSKYNILNAGLNPKPVVTVDTLAEMNIATGGFTPQQSGVYETRMLMEGVVGTVSGGVFTPGTAPQSLVACGWSTNPAAYPPNAVIMIETQGGGYFNNSHMTPLIMPLSAGVTYYMICWENQPFVFNNLTVQYPGPASPITPIVDFIIKRAN